MSEFPDSDIYFLTKHLYAEIVSGVIPDDHIIPYDDSFSGIFKIIKRLNTINFDYIIDLHRNQRSILIDSFVKGKVLKTKKRNIARRILINAKKKRYTDESIVTDHHSALRIFELKKEYPPKLVVEKDDLDYAKKIGIDNKTIILHPGAKWPLKKWGDEKYDELSTYFSEAGYNPVFIDESEGSHPDHRRVIGGLSLSRLKGVLSSAALYIGNDSGPGHIAAALGTPTIAIFGPTHPALGFSPAGQKVMVIQNNFECSPCTLHGKGNCLVNKSPSAECMKKLLSKEVFDKAINLIK